MTPALSPHVRRLTTGLSLAVIALMILAVLLAAYLPATVAPRSYAVCRAWYSLPDGRIRITDYFCRPNAQPDFVYMVTYICDVRFVQWPTVERTEIIVNYAGCAVQYLGFNGF